MKVLLWILIVLGALILAGALALALRSRAARRVEETFHRDLPRALELSSPAFEDQGAMPVSIRTTTWAISARLMPS